MYALHSRGHKAISPLLQSSFKRPRLRYAIFPHPLSPEHSRFIHARPTHTASRYTTGDKLGAAICVLISGGTFSLGVWQTKRYYWKVERVNTRQARVEQRPMPLPEAADLSAGEAAYRRVFCEGEFVPGSDVLLGPRATPAATGGLNQSGFFVYTPMRTVDGTEVVVNRGWVPKQAVVDGKVDEAYAAPTGRIKLVGVVAVGETGGGFTPVNDLSKRRLLWLDFAALRELCKAAPQALVIDEVTSGSGGHSGPVKKTVENFMQFKVNPYTHIGYAATWYSLSAVALAFVRLRFLK